MSVPQVLLINGSVGAGKTSVADAIYNILSDAGGRCALIDMDFLRAFSPRPKDDPFGTQLGCVNLKSIANNYISHGIDNFIIPSVIESKEEIKKYRISVDPRAQVLTVRLEADIEVTKKRLAEREGPDSIEWCINRSEELTKSLRVGAIDDTAIQTDNISVQQIAAKILDFWNYNNESQH